MLPRAAAVAFVASLGLSALPVSAAALPALFYRWNDCDDAAVNLRFAAPGVYRQVLVASGFDQPTGGHTFSILITGFSGCAKATFPDAWRFDEAGCQSGQINWSTAGLGPACPGLVRPNPLYRNSYTYYSDQPAARRLSRRPGPASARCTAERPVRTAGAGAQPLSAPRLPALGRPSPARLGRHRGVC
jgi:hypothetical protein